MYSCCKPPELGRREIDPLEKRGQDWLHQEPECGISRYPETMLGTLPKAFSHAACFRGQLPKCQISLTATSLACSSRIAAFGA